MTIEVLKPGLSTTVQDLGRPGFYHLGIPVSGGMDRYALRAPNLLVRNEEGDAVLEVVFLGPELRFATDAFVAVTGAELPPKLDGVPCDTWTAITVKVGQVLSFDFLKAGARLCRGVGRHRCAARPRQPLDIRARGAGRT